MMNTQWRRFAPLGLYIALLAALVAAGLYIVQRAWNLPLQISLGIVIIGLALFAVLEKKRDSIEAWTEQLRHWER